MNTTQSQEFDTFHEEVQFAAGLSRKPLQCCCTCTDCTSLNFPCIEMALCRNLHNQRLKHLERFLRRNNSFMKNLHTGRLLGSGGFGSVYEAIIQGRKMAVKRMRRRSKNPRAVYESLEAEKLILPLRHPNVVRTFAVLEMENLEDVLIIMEFAGSRNLQSLIDNDREGIDCKRRLKFASDITRALEAIHSDNLVHLDLKPANVIVNSQDTCKLGDFGCCQLVDPGNEDNDCLPPSPTQSPNSRSFLTGTFAYRAPELLKGEPPSVKADMYSLGICLWQLLSREQPYGLESQFVVIFGVVANHMRPSLSGLRESHNTASCSAYLQLVISLWQSEPMKRPCASEVMELLQSMRTT